MSILVLLIWVFNELNDTCVLCNINLGYRNVIRKTLLNSNKSFDINNHNYQPVIFDSKEVKFVWG